MRLTAGELAHKALSDQTKYDALEVGHAMAEDVEKHLHECIQNHLDKIDQDQFCVVMIVAKDLLLKNLIRRKFYCWPYLPKPRPNQAVFLYDKKAGKITKRLWVLPSDMVMAELSSLHTVHKKYKTMQQWSQAFFAGRFWEFIREQHAIDMLSEHETDLKNSKEGIGLAVNESNFGLGKSLDFSNVDMQ